MSYLNGTNIVFGFRVVVDYCDEVVANMKLFRMTVWIVIFIGHEGSDMKNNYKRISRKKVK